MARQRKGLVFFAGDLGFRRLKGYSHDLRQRAYSLFCNPHTTARRNCTPFVYGCREELPQSCARWVPGVKITTHSHRYKDELREHTFCLAFPGDGWSSRVLDGLVHGCIPVIVQDESDMFFEGAFGASGMGFDYADFSVRIAEAQLHTLVDVLAAIPKKRVLQLRRVVMHVRDYFIYKDMYNPSKEHRARLLRLGRPKQDAFLLLALGLEAKARALGKLSERGSEWRSRNRALLRVDELHKGVRLASAHELPKG